MKYLVLFFSLSLFLASPAVYGAVPRNVEGPDVISGTAVKRGLAGGGPSLVVFLSSRCPCSISHEPVLKVLAARYPEVRFVGVVSNRHESDQELREHFARARLPFPVIRDGSGQLADAFRALKTPHVFLLDPDGKVIFQGGVDDSREASRAERHYLADALAALRDGRPIPVADVRTLGCSIR